MRNKVLAYLSTHNVMTLATCGPGGPWAAAVFYANRDFELYFLSSPDTRHALELARDPRVAAAIHEDYRDWREIQGIQLSGRVERLHGTAREAALDCYRTKFGFLADTSEALAPVLAALEKAGCYQLTPSEAHFVDNTSGFGRRARVPLE
jgi:uncharacterized protein YhbP (UPF0306 family)